MTEENFNQEKKKLPFWFWIILIIAILLVIGFLALPILKKSKTTLNSSTFDLPKNTTGQNAAWKEKGVAIAGNYADADVVDLGNGPSTGSGRAKYRMYYAIEPEVKGNNLEIYSSISVDGINWTKEDGIRKTMATFPDLVKLSDGSWRMYFQNAGVIKSAKSTDGLSWQDESGVRINTDETGYTISQVAAPTTMQLIEGSYLMVYSGTMNQLYQTSEKLPNSDTRLFFYATSSDGLNFTKQGLALDTRNDTLLGFADGPDLVNWDKQIRLYFWSYKGVYHLTYTNGKFSTEPTFDFTNNSDPKIKFPSNPPGDPTLIKIGDNWFMYYGQHTKGIYRGVLE